MTKVYQDLIQQYFKENPFWNHNLSACGFGFSAKSFKDLYKSISSLPINYKQENLEFLYKLQTNNQYHRKHGETKKLIISSLLKEPKTLSELAKELCIRQGSVSDHIKELPIVIKIDEKILRRGGYAKVNIFGIKNVLEAQKFLKH